MPHFENSDEWFDSFVEKTRGPLARYLQGFLPSADDVQGVIQDAYLRLVVTLRKDLDRDHTPSALLYRIAKNLAVSRLRHQKVVDHSAAVVSVAEELRRERRSAEQTVGESQKLNELMLVVNALPPKCREVMILRWIYGLSQRAIGEQLGIAVSTVEKHLAKGLRHCRNELQPKADSEPKLQRTGSRRRAGRAG